jgi:alpha-beta hydrolase superfamily lysophospholipase
MSIELGWSNDTIVPGMEQVSLQFPDDYDGQVVATLVRAPRLRNSRRAVLYVHGFVDYFFQQHLADAYAAHGYDFYALDLRKYGRSLRPGQHSNFCRDLSEYDAEITRALEIIEADERYSFLLLNGHSTGGLVAALYADHGARRAEIDALFLNSPFFEFNTPPALSALRQVLAQVGRVAPFANLPDALSPIYGESIHKQYRGEWDYDLNWKPLKGFPAYWGWLNAIQKAQGSVHAGLNIQCPVLVMHSSKSGNGKEWREEFRECDAVLNVEQIRRRSEKLGPKVTQIEIQGGLHDLTLSRSDVRARVFEELFRWLASVGDGR